MEIQTTKSLYLTQPRFAHILAQNLEGQSLVHDGIVLSDAPAAPSPWAHDIWVDVKCLQENSINTLAKALRGLGKNWALTPCESHRRAALIQNALPKCKIPSVNFPDKPVLPNIGGWLLWQPDLILASTHRWKKYPGGLIPFNEDKALPPNRAYLKLWEILTLLDTRPGPGDTCLDLGASPGGWTWVLQGLGASVTAIDKAPLDPAIAKLPRVTQKIDSAFAIDPKKHEMIDWVFSDVICYPDKLYKTVIRWIDSGNCRHLVATIKLQGEPSLEVIKPFLEIPNSHVLHLGQNKNELTFVWPRNEGLLLEHIG